MWDTSQFIAINVYDVPDHTTDVTCWSSEVSAGAELQCFVTPMKEGIPIYASDTDLGTVSVMQIVLDDMLHGKYDEAWLHEYLMVLDTDADFTVITTGVSSHFQYSLRILNSHHTAAVHLEISPDHVFNFDSVPPGYAYSFSFLGAMSDREYTVSKQTYGRSTTNYVLDDQVLLDSYAHNFIQVSCSTKVCLALDTAHTVYSWGDTGGQTYALNNVLGRESVDTAVPATVTYITSQKSKSVWAWSPPTNLFDYHHYLLTEEGEIWYWGNTTMMYLFVTHDDQAEGIAEFTYYSLYEEDPMHYPAPFLSPDPVSIMVTGGELGLFATTSGDVYTWHPQVEFDPLMAFGAVSTDWLSPRLLITATPGMQVTTLFSYITYSSSSTTTGLRSSPGAMVCSIPPSTPAGSPLRIPTSISAVVILSCSWKGLAPSSTHWTRTEISGVCLCSQTTRNFTESLGLSWTRLLFSKMAGLSSAPSTLSVWADGPSWRRTSKEVCGTGPATPPI